MVSHSILLRMRDVADESCRENQNILCSKHCAGYEILWKVHPDGPQITNNIIRSMRLAFWITMTADTHNM